MAKRKYSEVGTIGALKQTEAGAARPKWGGSEGVSKHTGYAWKAKYGGMTVGEAAAANDCRMTVGEAQRLQRLPDEHGRLKKLVADLSLDKELYEPEERRAAAGGSVPLPGRRQF